MTDIFNMCGGIIATVISGMGGSVSLLGSLFITFMSFILLLTVYGCFFRFYMFTALAPLPLAAFAGEGTAASGKAFLKSYIGVCMEGAVIVLACLIYSAFLSSSTLAADATLPAVTMVWQYIGQLIFNMLILTCPVRGRIGSRRRY